MAPIDPPIRTYSDTTAHRRAISDYISFIDPTDTPVIAYFGLEADPGQFRIQNFPHTKVEWLEDAYADLTDALNGSITSAATTITVDDGTLFKKGDVLLVDSEYMWVSSISAQVLTVTRNFGGTQATHADNAAVEIVSKARLEGGDWENDYKTDITAPYNYTQIVDKTVQVTRSQQKLMQWGISDEMEYQVGKAIPELTVILEKTFFHGQRKSGSATAPRGMGGLPTFVTANSTNLSSTALLRNHLETTAQYIFEDGGKPDLIICNGWVKRKITSFYEPAVRTERVDERGGTRISYVETEFGEMQVLLSRHCPKTKLYMLSSEHIGFVPYDPFARVPVAPQGDYVREAVVGEFTLVVRHGAAGHGYIYGISTAS